MEVPALTDLSQRLDRMNPEAKALWGKMSLAQMLTHCRLALEAGLGDYKLTPMGNFLKRWLMFPLMIRLPWPQGKAPTHPELNMVDRGLPFRSVAEEAADLKARLAVWQQGKFGHVEHSIFGKLSKPGWDVLQRRHLDHHFRQFGI
jgi:hypothetical protein